MEILWMEPVQSSWRGIRNYFLAEKDGEVYLDYLTMYDSGLRTDTAKAIAMLSEFELDYRRYIVEKGKKEILSEDLILEKLEKLPEEYQESYRAKMALRNL